ncbi:hypothetical protein GCM10022224_055820 [Nonomuraea antimicrobica]|uniref:Uncharacterized protein n=1 Tax=Nonomuraea antimicrobica TaxID=561173 RepID=A0ABP7CD65_9ACTN
MTRLIVGSTDGPAPYKSMEERNEADPAVPREAFDDVVDDLLDP